jgi:3-methyladenine DNA glycosylase AlkD
MARFGINPDRAFSVRIPDLRRLAGELGPSHVLALSLWRTGVHEARKLASMVDQPERVTERQLERWVKDFDAWDACDQVCGNLLDLTAFATEKAHASAGRKAVKWALRQIGKRNRKLHAAALRTAERIRRRGTPPARWVAGDALRDLRSDRVVARLAR